MANYVNEDSFFSWYEKVTGETSYNKDQLLRDVFMAFANTGKGIYTVPAAKSLTGKAESIPFSCENLGCCGASTIIVTF